MNLIEKAVLLMREELDEFTLSKAKTFMTTELESDEFNQELDVYLEEMKSNKGPELEKENEDRNKFIITLTLLGMGRNRTLKILSDYELTRTMYEKVRDASSVNSSKRKKENEKKVTSFKFESRARQKRLKELSSVDWNSVKEEYLKGESPVKLAKKYGVSGHYITLQLIEEGLFDSTRSTLTKRKIAKKNKHKIDDNYIIRLVKENPLDSKEALWKKSKNKYPWILRRQLNDKIKELGLERTEEEVNQIRRIKSKVESNDSYMIKVNGYKAVKEVFGSVDNLVNKYMENKLGSFNKIADYINSKTSLDYSISVKQVSKIITGSSKYRREQSIGQQQLYQFVKKTFDKIKVEEEYSWGDNNKQIDVYIPELNVGLEFNGDYWHSDEVITYNYGKSSYDFHKERAERLKKKGIKLVYVWESDWNKNYKEIEEAIEKMEWDNPILNKYSNPNNRNYSSPNRKPSLLRNQVMRFLKENKVHYEKKNNSHIIKLTDHNMIINIPNYNSLSNRKETINLQKEMESKGIELITFLPWRNPFQIKQFLTYRLKLSSITKIPARKCVIVSNEGITKEQRKFFLDNHLLGYNNFSNIEKTITLEHNNETVMAALFVRKKGHDKVELKRLVSRYGLSIQGGASRLIKEYIRRNSEARIMYTFSDSDLGFGNVYEVIGFKMIERSKEQLTWYNEDQEMKFSNLSLVSKGADILLSGFPNYEHVGIGDNLPTNQEIVKSYGFIPIYDSGYKKWELDLKKED